MSKEALGPHLLEDLELDGFDAHDPRSREARVVVTRGNFGCGSCREHATWVFEVNGMNVIIASSFAQAFKRNMFNCGLLAIELPEADIEELFARRARGARLVVDFGGDRLTIVSDDGSRSFAYRLDEFDKALVESGGWIEFADSRY
jgi:3-isopropylmalate/(R)-2-methylmalate dehydratase small subunit